MNGLRHAILVCVAVGGAHAGRAASQDAPPSPADPGEPDAGDELELFELESNMNRSASSATGVSMRVSETPAIVTVITREEIESRGYRSLAEALRTVPGFYDVYDGVSHNIGVRGVNGGLNAAGDIIKVMIDGQPVDYRPTTGNFFGEELIPIQAVERVEIVRGPASALYGADAFLGVVNVITRDGSALKGWQVIGAAHATNFNPGYGVGTVAGGADERWDFLVAARYDQLDRSGLSLPKSGPRYVPGLGDTVNDVATPASFFGKMSYDGVLGGKLSLLGSIQRLDAMDPFFYLDPVNRDARVSLLNQHYRLKYTADFGDHVSVSASANYFDGAPTPDEKLSVGLGTINVSPGSLMIPQESAQGGGGAAEVRVKLSRVTLTGGADYLYENHLIVTYDQLLTLDTPGVGSAGDILPGQDPGLHKVFQNVGAYVQGVLTTPFGLNAIAGIRIDDHNIYGVNPTSRLGVVFVPNDSLSIKALYASSFKAPSAEQLYGQPIAIGGSAGGGLQGDPRLQAQHANGGDLDVELKLPRDLGDVQVNGYVTNVQGLVEYDLQSEYYVAGNNVNEWIAGGELSSHLLLTKPLTLTLNAGLAENVQQGSAGGGVITSATQVKDPLFPEGQVHVIADYALPWWGLKAAAEVSFISGRPSSYSNATLGQAVYQVAPYFYGAVALSTSGRRILPGRDTALSLRVTNVFAQNWTEPGFGGTDVPAQGLAATLTWIQGL